MGFTMTQFFSLVGSKSSATGYEAASAKLQWEKILFQLVSMKYLEDGWDGENSPAPSHGVIDALIGYLSSLQTQNNVPPADRAVTTPDGSISIEWQLQNGIVELETCQPGLLEFMYAEDDGSAEFETIEFQGCTHAPFHAEAISADNNYQYAVA